MKRTRLLCLLGAPLLAMALHAADNNPNSVPGVYLEADGLVVMEIENTASPYELWVKKTTITGYTGSGHLEFTGNRTSNGPPTSPLEFRFKISKAGLYYFHLHCAKDTTHGQPGDHSNDCYIRVEGDYAAGPNAGNEHGDDAPLSALQSDTKYYGGGANAWAWVRGNNLDLGGDRNKRVPVYDFKAGEEYKLVVSGRSKYFNINRIVYRHADTAVRDAHDLERSESEFLPDDGTNQPPNAVAAADSSAVNVGTLVTLSGSGSSDPDNGPNPLSYNWSQDGANPESVTLTDASGDNMDVSFTPTVAGSYSFTLTVTDGSATDTADVTVAVSSVGGDYVLSVECPSSATEGDGSVNATIRLDSPLGTGETMVVALSSSDESEATVPSSINLTAGVDSATFAITIVEDNELDGDQVVTLTAAADSAAAASAEITVQDNQIDDPGAGDGGVPPEDDGDDDGCTLGVSGTVAWYLPLLLAMLGLRIRRKHQN